MTVLLVAIFGDRTKAEWYDWVASRYEQNIGYATPREFVDPFAQGPRGALAGGKGGPPGSLSMALGGAGQESESEEEEEETANSNTGALRSIQEALRAQGINISGLGDLQGSDKEAPAATPVQSKFSEVVDADATPPTLTQTPPPI